MTNVRTEDNPRRTAAAATDRPRGHYDELTELTESRRTTAVVPVHRSARFVIVGVFIALVLSVVLWPYLGGGGRRLEVENLPAGPTEPGEGVTAAQYSGTNRAGNPYTVTARHVESLGTDGNKLALEDPRSVVTVGGVETYIVSADKGVLDRDTDLVDLHDDVELVHRSGYRFSSSSASINLDAGDAAGSEPVDAQGKLGRLHAQGFRFVDDGNVVYFLGKSRMTINGSIATPGQ